MEPEVLAALALMTITDRFLQRTCPAGVDLSVWRKQVKDFADVEEIWLKSILGKE